MGTYMTIHLKPEFINETFLEKVNRELKQKYGSPFDETFCSMAFLEKEADFFNNDPEGIQQCNTHEYLKTEAGKRPISANFLLSMGFFWWKPGTFESKLSGGCSKDDVNFILAQAALCLWAKTHSRYIDKQKSYNFSTPKVRSYLDHYFRELNIENVFNKT